MSKIRTPRAKKLGKRILHLRIEEEWTTEQLAQKARIGKSRLNRLENGNANLMVEEIERLCDVLGWTVPDFLDDAKWDRIERSKGKRDAYVAGSSPSRRGLASVHEGRDGLSHGSKSPRKCQDSGGNTD